MKNKVLRLKSLENVHFVSLTFLIIFLLLFIWVLLHFQVAFFLSNPSFTLFGCEGKVGKDMEISY